MLRDEQEVAVNDLVIALWEAAESYGTAAGIVTGPGRAELFAAAGDGHRKLAAALEDEQQALGHLPKAPDPETGLIRDAASHLKARLAEDEVIALLDERRQDEERIVACGQVLLDVTEPGPLGDLARQAIEAARRNIEEIERLAAAAGK